MDARHINAFVEAAKAVFTTMLNLEISFDRPSVICGNPTYDVSGVIGLSGDVVGSVIIGIPRSCASGIVRAFTGTEYEVGCAEFADAVGELVNMIAGGAKARFEGLNVSIGCPTVIIAPSHQVRNPSSALGICIPCQTPAGRLVIDVAFKSVGKSHASVSSPAANGTGQAAA
ncbi:MAG: chemotaxis protein CheX [Planctomycetota bacterium]|nr:chemotaxis protein CheX [Planctomycetota bacterium]